MECLSCPREDPGEFWRLLFLFSGSVSVLFSASSSGSESTSGSVSEACGESQLERDPPLSDVAAGKSREGLSQGLRRKGPDGDRETGSGRAPAGPPPLSFLCATAAPSMTGIPVVLVASVTRAFPSFPENLLPSGSRRPGLRVRDRNSASPGSGGAWHPGVRSRKEIEGGGEETVPLPTGAKAHRFLRSPPERAEPRTLIFSAPRRREAWRPSSRAVP